MNLLTSSVAETANCRHFCHAFLRALGALPPRRLKAGKRRRRQKKAEAKKRKEMRLEVTKRRRKRRKLRKKGPEQEMQSEEQAEHDHQMGVMTNIVKKSFPALDAAQATGIVLTLRGRASVLPAPAENHDQGEESAEPPSAVEVALWCFSY